MIADYNIVDSQICLLGHSMTNCETMQFRSVAAHQFLKKALIMSRNVDEGVLVDVRTNVYIYLTMQY